MNTFYTILQKHMKSNAIILPAQDSFSYWGNVMRNEKTTTQGNAIHIFFYFFIQKCYRDIKYYVPEYDDSHYTFDTYASIKFDALKEILNNSFLKNNQDSILELFSKTQKTYWIFSKLAQRFRVNRAQVQIKTDLYMNPIDSTCNSCIKIYQGGAIYIFKLSDLVNIMNAALSNSSHFFADPIYPKNPYTNVEFSRGILLKIYLKIRQSYHKLPILLYYFLLAEFELDDFVYHNEAIIREIHIKEYVEKSCHTILYPGVKEMLKFLDRKKKLQIHQEFPKDRLVNIMRPYLHLYYISEYSMQETPKRDEALDILKEKFKKFLIHNPQFGRKWVTPAGLHSNKKMTITFNDDHPKI